MKIIMGLGNPGGEYADNRHNLGFRCIDRLARQHSIQVKKTLCQSSTGEGSIEGTGVVLVKPKTFVNLSGKAASCLLGKFKCEPPDLIVVHDDLDLPTGRLRIRLGGKSGGHRGLKSIISCTGAEEFTRVRIGISRPSHEHSAAYEDAIVDHVLGDLTPQEEELILPAIEAACEAIKVLLAEGLEAAMNKYNKRG
jgi:peptidyl-tRNA hydrolase, PTH1 family